MVTRRCCGTDASSRGFEMTIRAEVIEALRRARAEAHKPNGDGREEPPPPNGPEDYGFVHTRPASSSEPRLSTQSRTISWFEPAPMPEGLSRVAAFDLAFLP